MKKGIVLGIIILVIGMSFTGSSYSLSMDISQTFNYEGNILYVGGSGEGNYTTIQSAIDDASDGDTVFVYNGIYFENLFINKSIDLIGADIDTTIIDGDDSGTVVYVLADWFRINGFTLKGGTFGIFLWYTSYVNITGNKITSISNCGITIYYSEYCIISKNMFMNNKNDLNLLYCANNDIFSNIIQDNNGTAINIHWTDTTNFYKNKIENIRTIGITIAHSIGGCILSNNTIKECGSTGVTLRYVKNCFIFRNTIENCGYKGIILTFASCRNSISQNKISNNSDGIFFGGLSGDVCDYNTISNNTISYNNKNGIFLLGATKNNIIDGNAVFNNGNFGISVEGSNKNIATGNEVFSNNLGGVGLYYDSNNNNISGNNIYDNSNYGGIYLRFSSDNKLYSNHIANNTFGININSSRKNKITNNNFINNCRNAFFYNGRNKWYGNFWDKVRLFPYLIFGQRTILFDKILIPCINIDWHPAKVPYDINATQGCGI